MFSLTVVLCTAAVYQLSDCSQPEVTIQQGTVKGLFTESASGRLYSTFLGIPYGKPPVGKHRFKQPVPAEPWIGVYNATIEPPSCLQIDHRKYNTPDAVHGSEDCLYLNVFTPRIDFHLTTETTQDKLLDVIAFIHGGAFMFYYSTGFNASYLLDRDVVLVTFNYRLGPLGFLSTGDTAVPGNNGMKDQVLALQWIQQNIAAFGGDPNRVTLTGLSAGGASVHYHLLSPLSKGLFKAAICASGTSLNPWSMAENSREKAQYVAKELGCPVEDSLSMLKCLRTRPAEHIVETTRHFLPWLYNPFSPYALVVEPPGPNAFLSDSPINIIKKGSASDVPLLLTFCKEEGLYPGAEIVSSPTHLNDLKNRWNELVPHLLDYNYTSPCDKTRDEVSQKVKEYYSINLETEIGSKNLIKAIGDRLFIHGIAKTAKFHASLYTSPVYVYRFSYTGKYTLSMVFGGGKDLGVSHADDVIYILPMKGLETRELEADRQVSKDMVNLWVTFAVNGTFSGQAVGQDLPKIVYTDIQGPKQLILNSVDDLGEERFWDSLNLNENIETTIPAHQEF